MFRVTHVNFEETLNALIGLDTFDVNEWKNDTRLSENGWDNRYQYEAAIIADTIKDKNVKSVLEIGSGPGLLSKYVQEKIGEVEYHLIDKIYAKETFEKNRWKGKFFIKDISMDLDTNELLEKYDLIICNDVLEHLIAPANIVKKIYGLMKDDSTFFVSVPNWRMAHQFLYRGLWDYDNFIYFMYIHQLQVINVYPSILMTPFYPKLDSEKCMPDELLQSWNFYFVTEKRK